MANEIRKSFGEYFEELMLAAHIPKALIPTNGFSTVTAASASLAAWAKAAQMIGASASASELIGAVSAGGGITAGSGGISLVAGGAATALSGVGAAYYLGCLFGAAIYAIQMTTVGDSWMDKFSVNDAQQLMDHAKAFGVSVPPGLSEKFLHAAARRSKTA